MSNMTFHESYGDVSAEQLRLYRKYNVSPSDHDALESVYGAGDSGRAELVAAVKKFSDGGSFSEYRMIQAAQQEGRI